MKAKIEAVMALLSMLCRRRTLPEVISDFYRAVLS